MIQRDLAAPIWRTVFQAIWIYWRLVFSGTIARFWQANWRFATFITYPHVLLLLEALCASVIAFVFEKGLEALGIPDPVQHRCLGLLFLAVLGAMLKYTENLTYLLYLLCDTIWTWEFSHRQRPEWDQRIDRFARYLVDVAATSDAEEIVIVGHSSGSFLGTEMLARALKLDPALGRHGPRIVLLTHRRKFSDRRIPRRVAGFSRSSAAAGGRAVDRLDRLPGAQGRDEFLPVRSDRRSRHRRRRRQAQPHDRARFAFRDIIKPEHYELFRWQFFRVHFQFVMANERPHAYDFFMIVCGPVPLSERMAVPDAALAIATGDAAARERAWKRIETAKPRPCRGRRTKQNGTFCPPQRLKSRDIPASARNPVPRRVGFGAPLWCKAWRFYGLRRAPAAGFLTAASTSNS